MRYLGAQFNRKKSTKNPERISMDNYIVVKSRITDNFIKIGSVEIKTKIPKKKTHYSPCIS